MIEITIPTPKGFEKLSSLPETVKNEMFKSMGEAARLIEQTSRKKYLSGPYPDKLTSDTGNLARGLFVYAQRYETEGQFGRIVAMSGARTEKGIHYSSVHEQQGGIAMGPLAGAIGSGFYIYAKSEKGMTFFWKRMGVWVHGAKMVVIPPRPFLWPAIIDNIDKITSMLHGSILRAFRSIE